MHDEVAGRRIAHGNVVPGIDAAARRAVHVDIVAMGDGLRAEGEAERLAGLPDDVASARQLGKNGIGAEDAAVERAHDDDIAERVMDGGKDFRGLAALPGAVVRRLDAGDGADVETSIIDGRIVMENRKILTVDADDVLERAQHATNGIVERLRKQGLPHMGKLIPAWPVV